MKGAVILALACACACVYGHGSTEHLAPSGYLYKDFSLQKPYLSVFGRDGDGASERWRERVRDQRVANWANVSHLSLSLSPATGLNMNGWDFQGNTVITDDYVRLTPDRQSKRGSIWTQKVRERMGELGVEERRRRRGARVRVRDDFLSSSQQALFLLTAPDP